VGQRHWEGFVAYWKAEQLLALATLTAGRHTGVTLDDVIERFTVSKRTAQRMLRALEAQFTDTTTFIDEDGRKRWRLPSAALRDLMSLSAEELAALDMAVETMKRAGLSAEAGELLNLREKMLALVPRSKAARSKPIMRPCSWRKDWLHDLDHASALTAKSWWQLARPLRLAAHWMLGIGRAMRVRPARGDLHPTAY